MDEKPELEEDSQNSSGEEQPDSSINEEQNDSQESKDSAGDLAERNKELYARAQKAEARLKEYQEKDKDSYVTPERLSEVEKRVSLRVDKNYSTDEIEYLEVYAKGRGIDITEAEQDPFVQAGINSMRQQKKSEESSPEPSNRGEFQNIYKDKELSKDEKAKKWAEQTASWRAKRNSVSYK